MMLSLAIYFAMHLIVIVTDIKLKWIAKEILIAVALLENV